MKWIGGTSSGTGGGESSGASLRRVASGTHLVEEGHELPGSLGAELNGVGGGGSGGGGGRGGLSLSPGGRHWGGLGINGNGNGMSSHPEGGGGGRGVPQRSATTGTLELMGSGIGDRKMS